MASDFLQRIGGNPLSGLMGGRECTTNMFGEKQNAHQDVSTVCHDVRCLNLGAGEQAYVSVRDLRRREGEAFAQMGSVCNLRTLELDTTLLLRVWVDEAPGSSGRHGERRVVGEVRIPLRCLISKYSACLYHTWVALESPGLHDSVASLGFMNADDGSTFDQAITDGPRQIGQPKACISVCRTANLGPNGKMIWVADTAPEQRAAGWGPLLLSQQQHALLSSLQHQKSVQASSSSPAGDSPDAQELQERNRQQSEEIVRLKAELDSAHGQLLQQPQQGRAQPSNSLFRTQPNVPSMHAAADPLLQAATGTGGLSVTQARPPGCSQEAEAKIQSLAQRIADLEGYLSDAEARERTAEQRLRNAVAEAEDAKALAEQSRGEAANVQAELDKISSEANLKIEQANNRIRTLREGRDKVEQDLQQCKNVTIGKLENEKVNLESENRQLAEQKEALLRIVEDLHQTCIAAGLNTAGRQSIDNITCTITQDFSTS